MVLATVAVPEPHDRICQGLYPAELRTDVTSFLSVSRTLAPVELLLLDGVVDLVGTNTPRM